MAPPPIRIDHRCRVSALDKETLWSLRSDALVRGVDGMPEFSVSLKSITQIRLQYAPTRFQPFRYVCRLSDSRRECAAFQNEHFSGFASFEDRSGSYRELVLALIRRRAALGPGCRYLGGASLANWLLQSSIMMGSLVILAAALFYFWSAAGWMTVVKLVIIGWMLPIGFRWVVKNKPGEFDPSAVPDHLLPRVDV